MTGKTMRRASSKKAEEVAHKVRGLAAQLLLRHELAGLRKTLAQLDDRCAFYESVHGGRSEQYREVAAERDMLLLHADRLLTQWAEKHVSIARIEA